MATFLRLRFSPKVSSSRRRLSWCSEAVVPNEKVSAMVIPPSVMEGVRFSLGLAYKRHLTERRKSNNVQFVVVHLVLD